MKKAKFKIRRFTFGKFLVLLYIICFLLMILLPLLWMFSLSFRESGAMDNIIPENLRFDNYPRAIELANERDYPVLQMYKNSIIVSFASVAITIVLSALAAYAFSKLKFTASRPIFYMILIGMVIPIQIFLIPVFIFSRYTGLLNNYIGLILPYVAFGMPLGIFIFKGFFDQIPKELSEAAKIDGASEFQTFLRIIIPISKPAISTVIIFLFLQNWNEFVLALVLLSKIKLYTIPVALSKFVGQFYFPWELYSAVVFLTSIPIIIIFIIFQNWFIKGLTAGAVKG